MVGAHPSLVTFPETHFWMDTVPFRRILRPFKIYGRKEIQVIERYLESHSYPKEILSDISGPYYSTVNWSSVLCRVLDSITPETVEGWVEKTPRHLHYIDLIDRSAPDLHFIHIIREGKDVVASLYEVSNKHPEHWYGAKSIDECINRWISDVEKSKRYLDHPRHEFVRYETLAQQPEAALKRMTEFLELPYHPDMIQSHREEAGRIIEDKESWKEANVAGRGKVDKFKRNFSTDEQKYIMERTEPVDLTVFNHNTTGTQ